MTLWDTMFSPYFRYVTADRFPDYMTNYLWVWSHVVSGASMMIIGISADRYMPGCCPTIPYGRRKSWHLFGV